MHESSCVEISNKPLSRLLSGFILFSSAFFFLYCLYSQEQNWDMLGYSASAVSIEDKDPAYIHDYVYRELRNYVSDEDFEKLTNGDSYRETMHKDPDAFIQQVPYYKIRIIFVSLIFILMSLGVNVFAAGHIISAAAAALGFIIFFYAYKKITEPAFWVLMPFYFILCGVHDAGQGVSADTLAFLWFGLICYSFINKHWAIFPLLVVSTLIRTDMVVFVALVLCYYFIFRPDLRSRSLITAVITAILYIFVNKVVGNYGWNTVFYFVFISDMQATHPDEFSKLGLSMQQYLATAMNNLRLILPENKFWLFVVNVLLQLILFLNLKSVSLNNKKEKIITLAMDPVISLTIICCGYIVLHYLLFPALWPRFFIGQYMIASLGLLYTLTCLLNKTVLSKDSSGDFPKP